MQAANALEILAPAAFNMTEREYRRDNQLAQLMQRLSRRMEIQLAPTGPIMTSRLRFLPFVAAVFACLAAPLQAADYPTRTVTVVVPFAAGGLTDVPARLFAALLQ